MNLRGIHLISANQCQLFFDNQFPDVLLLPRRCAPPEFVVSFLLHSLVWHFDIPEHFGMVCRDNARVDVGTRSKIVEDTSSDSGLDKVQRIFSLDINFNGKIL